jgi:Flp pilus assembly pilin Flp
MNKPALAVVKSNAAPSRKTLLRDQRGANLVEYIILVGVVALIALAGFKVFGERVDTKVKRQADKVGEI